LQGYADLIDRALAEDVGDGDATTESTVPVEARARATITQKAPGVISGLGVAEEVFLRLDPGAAIERLGREGEWREAGAGVLRVEGSARALLMAERTALNFLVRLSGIATLTAKVVRAIEEAGGGAKLLDTRKTTPGLRALEKAAVAHGGGVNHRAGLYDAILIKENHSALAGGVGEAVRRARAARPDLPLTVEVRDEAEIDEALEAGAQRLLLDNMSPDEIRAAVARVGGRAELEASGGIDPETVLVYATISGLHYVSMGALTHSAPGLDLSLILETLPNDPAHAREHPPAAG
jgi:nicotinate-nucleotide pyrophosphorylase (carboxylating)